MTGAVEETDVVILGAGLCGLAVGSVLGERALIFEREAQAGGLVRTICRNGYWFDQVLHLLHFQDKETEQRMRRLMGDILQPCPPVAWVECLQGTVHYPFQMHLGGFDRETVIRCVRDFAKVKFSPSTGNPVSYEDMLRRTFGESMCEVFFFPYNRKMWKRPLSELAPSGFDWNIARPDFDEVLAGAITSKSNTEIEVYNSNGWYPRPPLNALTRGIGVVSSTLAQHVPGLRLQHHVETIDLNAHTVQVRCSNGSSNFKFRNACVSTLPLPLTIRLCEQVPDDLMQECARLTWNRVYSVQLSIRGARPENRGHWHYYVDESLIFTRLIYLHNFDPDRAPQDGWPLLVEVTEPAECPVAMPEELMRRVRTDLDRIGVLPEGSQIVDEHVLVIDPAYVVFTPENRAIMQRARIFLEEHNVVPLGRYGRWEYSSMSGVLKDGFDWAEAFLAQQCLG
ncbi:MAG: protoporphyrinogen/coproporphyrinogen oxidase [Candidatus Electronema sp. V4]|uniref:protoporphyrinogen/coproporphyrinogen oxidase n=1 Tax=Candidatus Electronema sp. V4 TaxID=3454756 RepID=UPI0040558D1D